MNHLIKWYILYSTDFFNYECLIYFIILNLNKKLREQFLFYLMAVMSYIVIFLSFLLCLK